MRQISFSIFVFFSIILFCSLGTWQIYRLQWKLNLISEINNGLSSKPINYSNSRVINYQKVKFNGKFDLDKQIYLYNLNSKGVPGFDIITPIKLNTNEVLLVNRGWIEKELKESSQINSNIKTKKITGLLRKIYKPNMFKPENDLKNNIWFSINLNDMEKFTEIKYPNFVIFLENSEIKVPLPKKITIDMPNNHLKYAITWYSISISILFYYLYFRKKK